ncbi:hypothetical protein LCGC14_2891520, partial [marine sediment metagenome]
MKRETVVCDICDKPFKDEQHSTHFVVKAISRWNYRMDEPREYPKDVCSECIRFIGYLVRGSFKSAKYFRAFRQIFDMYISMCMSDQEKFVDILFE